MLEAGINDALPAMDEVVNVIERVEIPDGRDAVFFEELRVQPNDVARLGFESNDVNAAS